MDWSQTQMCCCVFLVMKEHHTTLYLSPLPSPFLLHPAVRVICLLWGEASRCSLLGSGPQGCAAWWEDRGCESPASQSSEAKLPGHSGDWGKCICSITWSKAGTCSSWFSGSAQECGVLRLHTASMKTPYYPISYKIIPDYPEVWGESICPNGWLKMVQPTLKIEK